MDQFKLVTDMTPKGDQPQAIGALTKGLLEGKKFQTLLGVTGSGKSLAADEPIWIYAEKTSEQLKPLLVSIGPFIDQIVDQVGFQRQVTDDRETEVVRAEAISKRYLALSLCPQTNRVEIKPILQFLRHRAPKTLYRIETACGRQITVTGDHNFWVLRDGRLTILRTKEIKKTDYLPIPLALPPVDDDLEWLDSTELLKGETLLVEARSLITRAIAQAGRARIGQVLASHYGFPYQKLRKLENGNDGRGMPLTVLTEIAETSGLNITPEDITRVAVGSQFHDHALPGRLAISDEFLRLCGYYVSEGHGEPNHRFFTITSGSRVITEDLFRTLDQLGLAYRRNRLDVHIASKVHTLLLARLAGTNARSKRLPFFWPQLSQRQLGELLRAYFEGDGGVARGNGVVASTASKRLASDLCYALLRFGIWARVYRVWQRATNSNHQGDNYWYVVISGEGNLRAFQTNVGFLSKRKQLALMREAEMTHNAKKDLIPGVAEALKRLRHSIGLSQGALASACGLNRSTLTVIEAGLASPMRSTAEKILSGIQSFAPRDDQALSWFQALMRCRWTKVAKIGAVPSSGPYVYDLSVADNETFFGGFGGVLVHNTFTIANVIERVQKPTLIVSHNKTLAAQLYSELKSFFPHNAVEYFVSYYDYYQPEAYVPSTDTYIEKDSAINDELDRLRLSATSSLMSRRDVIIVASVSCIYNLGDPGEYEELMISLEQGKTTRRDEILSWLVGIHYERNDIDFHRGTFRARGDVVDVFPAYRKTAYRMELSNNLLTRIREINPLTSDTIAELKQVVIYPAKHFVSTKEHILRACDSIQKELLETLRNLQAAGKLLEAQRLQSRTNYDIEMLKELGFCHGVENYSRHISGRPPGSRPFCLIDYFPKDYLMVIDESHVTVPQVRGMYEGDRARKETLVEYGFRLPSALDNRPQTFEEFESLINQAIFASATPGPYELKQTGGKAVEQVIRPTGLVDPVITVKPSDGQIEDLIIQVRARAEKKERVLVTTLTKRLSEDLTRYLSEAGLRVKYLHSEIEAIERVEILRDLRRGEFDCLVGINLLREGLDLPEVSLVAVLDADKEGFLRSATSLIQVAGRAARHLNGEVILYADQASGAMSAMIGETYRRRQKQVEYNQQHGITPTSIKKAIRESIETEREAEEIVLSESGQSPEDHEMRQMIADLEEEMLLCARNLQFERAAILRDKVRTLREKTDQRPETGDARLKQIKYGKTKSRA